MYNHKVIKNISADYILGISYGKSYYEAKNRINQPTVNLLVDDYNSIKLTGTTSQKIDNDHAITITFVQNDKISAQLTVDDKGVFSYTSERVKTTPLLKTVKYIKMH